MGERKKYLYKREKGERERKGWLLAENQGSG